MRYSKNLGKTLRNIPQSVKSEGFGLLIKAGFVRATGDGLYSLLPLGKKTMENLEAHISEEMDLLDGQIVSVPFVSPGALWQKSGRAEIYNEVIARFTDSNGNKFVLSPSHEESMVELVRSSITSYRDLPLFLYQFQLKFRDSSQSALHKTGYPREFVMKDAYSFHTTFSDLNNFFPKVFAAYVRLLKSWGIEPIEAERGVGFIGGMRSYGIYRSVEDGPEVILSCPNCGYRAHQDVAVSSKNYESMDILTMEKVVAPRCDNLKKALAFFDEKIEKLTLSRVFKSEDGFVLASVRADYEISIDKLSVVVGSKVIRLATTQEIKDLGLVPGYLSSVGLKTDIIQVVDESVAYSSNLIFGANEKDCYYKNVNFGLDFEVETVADIARMRKGDQCLQCGESLEAQSAVLICSLYKLGDEFSKKLGLSVQDERIGPIYPQMGSYGIDLFRLIISIVEENSDERGIVWPVTLAPFKIYLMSIGHSLGIKKIVEEIAGMLGNKVLFDDRNESISTKFKDCDLLGIPYRIVVSRRYIQDKKVEFLERKNRRKWLVPIDEIPMEIEKLLKDQQ